MTTSSIADQVVAELGDGWWVTPSPHGHRDEPYLTHGLDPDAPRIAVGRYGGRLTLVGLYPADRRVPEGLERRHVEISVGATRPASAIAAEIRRRLLPTYLANLQTVVAYDRRCHIEDREREDAALRLAKAAPGGYVQTLPSQWGKRTEHRVHGHLDPDDHGAGSVSVKLAPDGRSADLVELRRVPVDLVEDILARLAGRLL